MKFSSIFSVVLADSKEVQLVFQCFCFSYFDGRREGRARVMKGRKEGRKEGQVRIRKLSKHHMPEVRWVRRAQVTLPR
jgi:hypothetical protein